MRRRVAVRGARLINAVSGVELSCQGGRVRWLVLPCWATGSCADLVEESATEDNDNN